MVRRDAPITHRVSLAVSARQRRRAIQFLQARDIHPYIRIAHRVKGALEIEERVIVDHEIVVFLRGEGTFRTRTESIRIKAHDLVFIPPFLPHAMFTDEKTEHIGVHFDLTRRGATAHPEARRPYEVRLAGGLAFMRHRPLIGGDEIERNLAELVRFFAGESDSEQMAAHARLLAVLARLLEPSPSGRPRRGPGRTAARVERVVALMGSRLAEDLDPRELCRASGLAWSQFYSVFREQTGYSPMEYLRRLRMDTARALLSNAALSVKEVAALSGFSDPYYFSRVFRQLSGVSPERYRKALFVRSPSTRAWKVE